MGEGDLQTSSYNDANLSIMRLHEHWIASERYANAGALTKWKWKLDSIWRELYVDVLRNSNKDEVIKTNEKLKQNIANAKNSSILYNALNKRHEFLREVQDKAGKAGKYYDDDGL